MNVRAKKKTNECTLVRFQRNTSESLKKESAVFRLKRNGKKIETSEYVANLSLYFDQSRSVSNLTLSDLKNVLTGLSGTQETRKS